MAGHSTRAVLEEQRCTWPIETGFNSHGVEGRLGVAIEDGLYKGYFQLGRAPERMSWLGVSDATLELRDDRFTIAEDPEGASARKRGRPALDARYGAIDKVEVRSLGSPVKSLGLIVGATIFVAIFAVWSGWRRSGDSLSVLADLPLGWAVVLAGIFSVFIGGMAYAATRKWVVIHLADESGQRVVAAVQPKSTTCDAVVDSITTRRSLAGG